MDTTAVLAAYDEQIRRRTASEHTERDDGVIRRTGGEDGWNGVVWSDLDDLGARGTRGDPDPVDAAIAAQVRHFAGLPWEWKLYSYDEPGDLAERLLAAGLVAEPTETLLVAEVADLDLDVVPPPGVELRDVVDAEGAAALVAVHDDVFGGDHAGIGRAVLDGLARSPRTVAAVVAMTGGTPVSGARIEFTTGTDFAGLWGGGTLPAWRGRGVFRALVAYRAALAAARGFRYLQVDATEDSRPILERLGFVTLATTTPFVHPGRTA